MVSVRRVDEPPVSDTPGGVVVPSTNGAATAATEDEMINDMDGSHDNHVIRHGRHEPGHQITSGSESDHDDDLTTPILRFQILTKIDSSKRFQKFPM